MCGLNCYNRIKICCFLKITHIIVTNNQKYIPILLNELLEYLEMDENYE